MAVIFQQGMVSGELLSAKPLHPKQDPPDGHLIAVFQPDRYSDNDLVSEENQNLLLYWRDMFKTGQFSIGDITCQEIERAALNGFLVTHDRVFNAVGRYSGKKPRTVRYYYETALFYPPPVREEYLDLPFSHFVLARGYGEFWKDVLDYSKAHVGITEEQLDTQFDPERWRRAEAILEQDQETQIPVHVKEGEEDDPQADDLCEISQVLPRGRKLLSWHAVIREVNALISHITRVSSILAAMELSPEDRFIIESALNVLQRRLPNLIKK